MNIEPTQDKFEIKVATRNDMKAVYDLICELAEYEKLRHEVIGNFKDMEKWCFDEKVITIYCAWLNDQKIIGYTLSFRNYSTFLCKPGIYLEDLYIQPEYRSKGYGKKMILNLVKIAYDMGYGRVEWACLKWNKPSIDFYEKSLGAKQMNEWTTFRLCDETLKNCAEQYDKLYNSIKN